MTQITEAIYTQGVLKPTADLGLREQQRVRVTVEPIEDRREGHEAAIAEASRSLEQRFQEQADIWERETALLSATPMRVLHDSYQCIIAMGPEVVPLLLRDLQKTRRHWFWALRHLTRADPVPVSAPRARLPCYPLERSHHS